MNNFFTQSISLTNAAKNKIKYLISNEKKNNLRLRIYIIGGGCGGFQYCFKFDNKNNNDDLIIKQNDIELIIDYLSLQYLVGGCIDYIEKLEGSKFIVINPNAKITCSCGSSFSI
uniref:Iron-sulfur cluster insertion protein ErpA n=1 Tax=Candidatus Aschnera chinzeii TaxID=1485666 RepID=A0AAT9G4S4_9ENTR|nr:MAG: iron-sulfur cluster insertion protein ErpA [Candidatus Aschnera chinzeii]